MLVGLGWRITGHCDTADTRTVAITSRDAQGVRFIITAHKDMTFGWTDAGASEPGSKGRSYGGWMWLIYHLVADPWHMVCLGHWAVSTFIGRVTFAISSSTERQIFRGSLLRNFLEMMLLHDTASCKPLSPFSSGVASSNGQSFPCIIWIHIYIPFVYWVCPLAHCAEFWRSWRWQIWRLIHIPQPSDTSPVRTG